MVPIRHLPFSVVALAAFAVSGCNSSSPPQRNVSGNDTPARDPMLRPAGYSVGPLEGKYWLNRVCDTDSHLTITSVQVTPTKTIFDMRFNNVHIGSEPPRGRIRVAAPGQQTAFYIADPDRRVEYGLLNVEGIALEPKWMHLLERDVVDFRLTFERIPDSLTKFHLIEGKIPTLDNNNELPTTWTFMNVRLK